MPMVFYLSSAVAVAATFMAVTRLEAVHALLYLVVSLLAAAVMFYSLGAPMIAALEVIVYAGAIMVLFVFVVMLMNLGTRSRRQELRWLEPSTWYGPALLCAILAAEMIYVASRMTAQQATPAVVGPVQVGVSLYGPYLIGVELASMLLMAAAVGAWHLSTRSLGEQENPDGSGTDVARAAGSGNPDDTGRGGTAAAP